MVLKIKWACAKQIKVKLIAAGAERGRWRWECESDTYGAELILMIA